MEAKHLYGISFSEVSKIKEMDAIVLAVAHEEFAKIKIEEMDKMFGEGQKVLIDIKGLMSRSEYEKLGYNYWRL